MIVRELITKLGFQTDEKAAQNYDKALDGLKKTALGLSAAMVGLGAATIAFANSIASQGNMLAKTAKGVGLSISAYQELEYVLGRISTISRDQVGQGFRDASSRLAQARVEAGAMRDEFIKLGFSQDEIISGNVTTEKVFMRLASMAKNSSTEMAALVGSQRIFGEEVGRLLGPALRDTTDDVSALRDEFNRLSGGFSEQGAAASEAYEDAMLNLKTVFEGLKIAVGEGLLPILTNMIRIFTELIASNKAIINTRIKEFFAALFAVLKKFYQVGREVWNVVDNLVTSFTSWDNVLRVLAIGVALKSMVGLVGMLKTISQWVLIVFSNFMKLKKLFSFTLIGALMLFLDDLWSWYQGNDSLLGRLFGKWEDAIAKIKNALIDFGSWLKDWFLLTDLREWLFNPQVNKMGIPDDGSVPDNVIPFRRANPVEDFGMPVMPKTSSTQNVNVNTKAELIVPPGSSQEQKDAMKKQADQIFDEYNRQITNSIIQFRAAE